MATKLDKGLYKASLNFPAYLLVSGTVPGIVVLFYKGIPSTLYSKISRDMVDRFRPGDARRVQSTLYKFFEERDFLSMSQYSLSNSGYYMRSSRMSVVPLNRLVSYFNGEIVPCRLYLCMKKIKLKYFC